MQKKAIRAIGHGFNNYFYNKNTGDIPCHTKPIFNAHDLLTVHNIVAKNCLLFMHKIQLDISPPKIKDLFNIANNDGIRTRREPKFFEVPYTRLKTLDRTLWIKGPKLYNSILNVVNKNIPIGSSQLQHRFTNSFKSVVTQYLLDIQKTDGMTWSYSNFVI